MINFNDNVLLSPTVKTMLEQDLGPVFKSLEQNGKVLSTHAKVFRYDDREMIRLHVTGKTGVYFYVVPSGDGKSYVTIYSGSSRTDIMVRYREHMNSGGKINHFLSLYPSYKDNLCFGFVGFILNTSDSTTIRIITHAVEGVMFQDGCGPLFGVLNINKDPSGGDSSSYKHFIFDADSGVLLHVCYSKKAFMRLIGCFDNAETYNRHTASFARLYGRFKVVIDPHLTRYEDDVIFRPNTRL